jgi:transcriptional regulator with XRE-family HTH domain
MFVECRLREIRGERSLRELAKAAGLNRGDLSRLERGLRLPPDEWIEQLEEAYGAPRHDWYPPHVLLALSARDPE